MMSLNFCDAFYDSLELHQFLLTRQSFDVLLEPLLPLSF
jgi:hypothetical protein